MNNVELGKYGEKMASDFLIKQNYKILERNFKSKRGEIDIIAKIKNVVVFVEVKTRRSIKYGKPIEAVNQIKQNHIIKAANYYLYKNKLSDCLVRFDIIEVYIQYGKIYINQIKNAF